MLIIAEQVEDRVESVQDSEEDQLSSTRDSEEDKSSAVETKTDGELIGRVYYQVCIYRTENVPRLVQTSLCIIAAFSTVT